MNFIKVRAAHQSAVLHKYLSALKSPVAKYQNMIVLNSPNILLKNKDHFLQQPAIMVASGPSLEDEIENLQD